MLKRELTTLRLKILSLHIVCDQIFESQRNGYFRFPI